MSRMSIPSTTQSSTPCGSTHRARPGSPRGRGEPFLLPDVWSESAGHPRPAVLPPWEPTRVSHYRTVFPQMTLWLPEDEAAQLRFEFERELARLVDGT